MGAAYLCFSSVTSKNVEHWTSVMGDFAAHGHPEMALRLFAEMRQLGIERSSVTFVAVLNACSHGDLVEEGFKYFSLMRIMGIKPMIQHYGCLVYLLGRAGFLEEAFKLARGCCSDVGRRQTQSQAMAVPSSYVLLSNAYARAGQWEDLKRTRMRMEQHGVMKKPGLSWIELDGNVHFFVTADKLHTESDDIYQMSGDLKLNLISAGYEPEIFALPEI